MAAPASNDERSPEAGAADREFWISGFLEALRRYRRVTIVGWLVAFGGVLSLVLRWRATGLAGLLEIMLSGATVAGGILLVHYGIEGLSAFIRTSLGALKAQELAELRALMEEVERGGWQEAFAALGRVRSMIAHRTGA